MEYLKVCSSNFGYITKIAVMLVCSETPYRDFLLQNKKANYAEYWYVRM